MGPVIYGIYARIVSRRWRNWTAEGYPCFVLPDGEVTLSLEKSYKKLYNRLKVIKSYIEGEKIEQSIYIIFWKKTTKVYFAYCADEPDYR